MYLRRERGHYSQCQKQNRDCMMQAWTNGSQHKQWQTPAVRSCQHSTWRSELTRERTTGWVLFIKLSKRPLATSDALRERVCTLFAMGWSVVHGCFPTSFPHCQSFLLPSPRRSPFWLGQLFMKSWNIRHERKPHFLSCNPLILKLNNSKNTTHLKNKKTLRAINNLKSTHKLHSEWF